MSCTHDCGCTPEIRDARTDEWVQIAPESARGGCMADFDAPQAPGQGEDSLSPSEPVFIDPATLAPGTAVEIEWPTTRDRFLYYADEGGYQITAGKVGNGDPYPWKDGRIVRVLTTEDKPAQEPVLPRRIEPEDVRVGMVVERRKGEAAHRDRVQHIDDERIVGTDGAWLWVPGNADGGWTLWLVEDAPAPVDPDAEAVERMAKEVHDRNCADDGCRDWDGHGESTRKAWRDDARVVLRNLRAQGFDVTARAEQ